MASIERKTKRYPTDLTDEEWSCIAPLLPGPVRRGRKAGCEFAHTNAFGTGDHELPPSFDRVEVVLGRLRWSSPLRAGDDILKPGLGLFDGK